MVFIKSGELYWNGKQFVKDYHRAIVFGAIMGCAKDLYRATKIAPNCKIIPLDAQQWAEISRTYPPRTASH